MTTSRLLCLGLSLLSFLFIGACSDQEAEQEANVRPVRAMQLESSTVLEQKVFPGRARATQEVDLSFRVSGPLVELPVDVGDSVSAGQVLARIDPRDYQVLLDNMSSQLARAKVALTLAESEYQRVLRIKRADPGATSQSVIDNKVAVKNQASANVRSLQASVQSARNQLDYTRLKASFDGEIVAKYVNNFEFVNAMKPIVRVLDSSKIEIVINIPETLITQAKTVTGTKVRFDAFPGRQLDARVKEIGTEASRITRTYPVTLIMDQPTDIRILPGMAGNAEFESSHTATGSIREQIIIPVSSVFPSEDKAATFVWVIDREKMQVSRRKVRLGELRNSGVPVIGGLSSGEWIVTAGVSYLTDGQQVELLQGEKSE